jgi:hypothetical protein
MGDNKQPSGNQAGPSSAPPETQEGLQETIQSGDKIVAGARNDDQLQRLNDAANEPSAEDGVNAQDEDRPTEPDKPLW